MDHPSPTRAPTVRRSDVRTGERGPAARPVRPDGSRSPGRRGECRPPSALPALAGESRRARRASRDHSEKTTLSVSAVNALLGRAAVAVFLGGAVGAGARTALATAWPPAPGHWPWLTFFVNVAGALLLGRLARAPRLFWTVGFCSALTTFATLQLELLQMLDAGRTALAAAYAAASVTAGLAGAGRAGRGRAARRRAAAHRHRPGGRLHHVLDVDAAGPAARRPCRRGLRAGEPGPGPAGGVGGAGDRRLSPRLHAVSRPGRLTRFTFSPPGGRT